MSYHLLAMLLFAPGSALLQQTPYVTGREGQPLNFSCVQKETFYVYMYWYKQGEKDTKLELVAFTSEGSRGDSAIENTFKNRFKTPGMRNYALPLSLEKAQLEDTGTYYCATQDGADPLRFGQGTHLTVLEKGQDYTPPSLTIFAPSRTELKEKQKATIVCLVTDFFPNHISLSWSINDRHVTEGVKTEDPIYENKKYSLISRLRVTRNQWQNSRNIFNCEVKFYSNSTYTVRDFIVGENCDGNTTAIDPYAREVNLGKLVYLLLIFKSSLYGVFVMVLKLRKKVL